MSYKSNKLSTIKSIIETNDNVSQLASALQIKTNIFEKSIKIVNQQNEIIMHFSIDEITSIELKDNSLGVYTSDEIPFIIFFPTNDETEIANERLNDIINGANLI